MTSQVLTMEKRGRKLAAAPLTEEQKLQAQEMFQAKKMMIKDISLELKIPRQYVSQHLHSIGLGGHTNNKWLGSDQWKVALEKGRQKRAEQIALRKAHPVVENKVGHKSKMFEVGKSVVKMSSVSLTVNGISMTGKAEDLAAVLEHLK